MRSQKEILKQYKFWLSSDPFNIKANDLICYMDFKIAKPFINNLTKVQWESVKFNNSKNDIVDKIKSLIPLSMENAKDGKFIEVHNCLCHFTVWTWLLNDDIYFNDLTNINDNGLNVLISIADFYGINWIEFL